MKNALIFETILKNDNHFFCNIFVKKMLLSKVSLLQSKLWPFWQALQTMIKNSLLLLNERIVFCIKVGISD
jgi:hypothetical protein